MERVAIDIEDPFSKTDADFTKWTEAYSIPNQKICMVAEVLVRELFWRFDVPFKIHSDQGRDFRSAIF